ncbi:MAG: SDR family NAD(P)-dependent oxidoreductase [Ferrimonas sp.]
MRKTILITGASDGIGKRTAHHLCQLGHHVLIHGRDPAKIAQVEMELQDYSKAKIESYIADLSDLNSVVQFAEAVAQQHPKLDVLINNAGIFATPNTLTKDGLDVRFAVNAIAPYVLTQRLLPILGAEGRVVNLSSAAQAPVNLEALASVPRLSDSAAYAQSKLALTMWSCELGQQHPQGPMIVAVNPKSFLGSKMVKDAYGIAGGNLDLGADVLVRASLDASFAQANGQYFDNDAECFAQPHLDALDHAKNSALIAAIEQVVAQKLHAA